MDHRIRLVLQGEHGGKLGGEVEVDETFIGGKARNMHLSKRRERITAPGPKDKVAVMGMVKRGGEVRAFVIPNNRRKHLRPRIEEHVEAASAISTKEAARERRGKR